jgi:hypothetical protein
MDRRKLIVRRFGVLSFGLGYFENGVWVDHLVAPKGAYDDGVAEVHALLGCCSGRTQSGLTAFAIAAAATTKGSPEEQVAVQGRSASS